jgi:hypothetical protein
MEEGKKPKKSFVQLCADMKNTLKKSNVDLHGHIMFGVEVDENGTPSVILSSVQTGHYTGLGMLEALQMMLDKTRDDMSAGFYNLLEDQSPSAPLAGVPKEILDKVPPEEIKKAMDNAVDDTKAKLEQVGGDVDKEVAAILEEFKDELGDALMSKDEKKLKEVEDKIHARIKEIKGPDFLAKFVFGISGPDTPMTPGGIPPGGIPMGGIPFGQPNTGFDSKNIRKYF